MTTPGIIEEQLANFTPAQADPREQVLMRYCHGQGHFSQDKRFINLQMQMFAPEGEADGYMAGVWQARFNNPQELLQRPPQPQRPFSVPEGPIQAIEPQANTKGTWTFGDGSSITAVGPATSSLTPLPDGSFLFMVATMQWITNGSGRFAGAQGLKSSLGSTHVPAGVDLFGGDFFTFQATTIDTFRLMPGPYIAQLGAAAAPVGGITPQ